MIRFRRLAVIPLSVVLVLSGFIAVSAHPEARGDPGDPGTPAPAPDSAPPVAWSQLGRSDRLDIVGSDQSVDTDIPVPPGVTLGVLTGEIGSVVDVVDGRIDVLDGQGGLLGTVPVPADRGSAPMVVDISHAQVTDGTAKLSFVLRDRSPPGDSCSRPPSVTVNNLRSTYVGEAAYPGVVADFRPGYTDQIVIRTGPSPTLAQEQAALELVAQLTRYYRPMPVRIEADTTAGPMPPGPSTRRVIELREADSPGMAVVSPSSPDAVLVISGQGSELSQQVQLFADRRTELAQGPTATVKAATIDAPQGTTIKTFAQLGITGDISVLGAATLYVGFDVSQFAVGSIQQASLRLIAHYTPVIGGEASAVVRSGNTVIGTRRLDESGRLDMAGTIPPEAIQSTVGIAVQLRYQPSQRCAPLNDRIQFTVDPESTISVTPGSRNRGGFPVLPMAFTPEFNVAIDQPEHLRFAAQAINLLAQQTTTTLQPHLTSLAQAAGSGLGALIVAPGEELSRAGLVPTILSRGTASLDIAGTTSTDVDLNGPIGVIQAFSRRGATILAIDGVGDWSLVQACFDYIRARPSRWASLTGDVVATGALRRTVNLTLREGGALADEYPGDHWKWWTWVTVSLIGVAVCTSAGILFWRKRNRRSA